MLYEPPYARIPASAAALSARPLVSAESFTCLYGFPGQHLREELTGDLKLVADALFANGVNRIVWHGMPFNAAGGDRNAFYATVHVGREGALAPHLRAFNRYLETVCEVLSRGTTYTDVAVYLPLEDAWIAGEYPPELQMKWSWGAYELRYMRPAGELYGHHPLWVSRPFLQAAQWRDMNQPSFLKFQSILESGGLILVNSSMVNVAAARGDIEVVDVPTSELAEKLGNIKAANMVMLGAFIKASNLESLPLMLKNLPEILGEGKAKLIKINKEALERGYNYIKE